jgi:hypothetical protein
MGELSLLSPQLITHLHSKNIWFLYQARARSNSMYSPDYWISSDALGLSTELATLWNNFCMALTLSGIHLSDLAGHTSVDWGRSFGTYHYT